MYIKFNPFIAYLIFRSPVAHRVNLTQTIPPPVYTTYLDFIIAFEIYCKITSLILTYELNLIVKNSFIQDYVSKNVYLKVDYKINFFDKLKSQIEL